EQGLYALPHKFDIYLGMYRHDLFDAAGVPPPAEGFTYDDLIGAAEQLQSTQGENPAVTIALQGPGPAFTTWSAIFRSHGGEYFDANKYPLFTNEAAVTAVETLRSLLPYMPIDALSLAFDPAVRIMAQGRTAFAENWNSFLPPLLDPEQSTVVDKVAFIPTPAGPVRRAQELGGWCVGLSPDSRNKEAAFLLLQHLTSKETAVQYALAGGSSARVSVATNEQVVEQIPYYPLMIDALQNAVPRPTDPTWGQTQGAIGTAVNAALQPGGSALSELTEAARTVYQVVQRMGFHPEETGPPPE
ncbi:MAG: extracellular solute-binding protein, partial [Chloroflexota bacterium]